VYPKNVSYMTSWDETVLNQCESI